MRFLASSKLDHIAWEYCVCCTGNMRKEARLEEIVPQSEYQTDPARLVLPNALLIEGDPDLGFVPCVGRVLERAFKA